MEKKAEKAKLVVDIYNIPKRSRFKNKKVFNLPSISAIEAVFDMWENKVTKLYVPKDGIPGYDFTKLGPKFNVKIETY